MATEDIFSKDRWPAIRGLAVDVLGVKPDTARKWTKNGVPGKWHLSLLKAARKRGVPLNDRELLSATSLRNGG